MEEKMTEVNETLKVETYNFCSLITKNLQIPEYQRPYTWSKKHIDKMLEDFAEFLQDIEKQQYYYMGVILLHKDDKNFNIIDGQQRITSILLLNYIVNDCTIDFDIKYSNPQSQKNIKENYDLLNNKDNKKNLEKYKDIFAKLIFTVVTTTDQDNAFLFFDTQNNRGVKADVSVLLKSYNLRCITNLEKQKKYAKLWEQQEKTPSKIKLSEASNQVEWLIKIYLWRVRNWRGNKKHSFGNYEDFRDDFTKNLRNNKDGYIKYSSSFIKIINTENNVIIHKNKNNNYFDFNTRQPLYSGECFFEFVNYYAVLLTELHSLKINNSEFRELQSIFRYGSSYMASFFTMVCLFYYERFGSYKFDEFVKHFANLVADIRINQAQIRKQTMQKQFIRCESPKIKQNILDFIAGAFDSEEIIEWLGNYNYRENDKLTGKRENFNKKYKEFWGDK